MIVSIRRYFCYFDFTFCFILFIILIVCTTTNRDIGATTVYLVVIDGGADWMAYKDMMVQDKFPWIHFVHCVTHQEGSLVIKDICKIDEVRSVLCYYCMHLSLTCIYINYTDFQIDNVTQRCPKVVPDQ